MNKDIKQDIHNINSRLDHMEENLAKILHRMDILMKSVQPLLSEQKEKAIKKEKTASNDEIPNKNSSRMIKDVAKEYGLSTRALSVLTRRKMKRMADFLYVDLERIQNLRLAGNKTIPEIVAFAKHYGFEIPEYRDLAFNIKIFDEVKTQYDTDGLPKGSVLEVSDTKSPGKDNPFPLYECFYEKDGRREWVTFTPSEVRKIE